MNNIFDEDINDIFTNYLIEALFHVQPHTNETNQINETLHQSLNDTNPIKHVISDEEKNKLIPVPFKDCRNKEENTRCSITQEEFQDDDLVIQLPCDHCFCQEDIMNWLTKEKGECPVCRYKFECVEFREQVEQEQEQQPAQYYNYDNYILQPNNILANYFNYVNNHNFVNNNYIYNTEQEDEPEQIPNNEIPEPEID